MINSNNKLIKLRIILLVGPSQKAKGGVATHINNLLKSPLNNIFNFIHFQIGSDNSKIKNPLIRFALSLFNFFYILIKNPPDIVHINPSFDKKSFPRDLFYLVISKLFHIKTIIQFHGGEPFVLYKKNYFWKRLFSFLNLADQIIVITQSQREQLLHILTSKNVIQIPNMVDLTKFSQIEKLELKETCFSILFASRIIIEKGIYDSLNLIPLLIPHIPSFKLNIMGDGVELINAISYVKQKKLYNYVKFHGFLSGEEKIRLYKESSIFIFPTRLPEGFPYVIIEAMASGLPVISYPSGAISEVIEDNINGYIIQSKNIEDMSEKIILLYNNPTLQSEISTNNINKVKKFYDFPIVSKSFIEIYNSTINASS